MWDEIIDEVRKHPKLKGKELPEALTTASGDPWERDAQQISALDEFLSANSIELPSDLTPFSERGKVAAWVRRSAGQTGRRAKETKPETQPEAEE